MSSVVKEQMERPRTQSEWIVGVVSTVVASILGGAAVI
ncbi:hypothetical protein ACI0FN_00115 [Alcaligenes nematophilus]|jgi:hypothetical protein